MHKERPHIIYLFKRGGEKLAGEDYCRPTLVDINDNGSTEPGIQPEGIIVVVLILAGVYTVIGGVTLAIAGGIWAVAVGATEVTV